MEGNASDLHIALPDILSPEEALAIGYYGIGLKSGAWEFPVRPIGCSSPRAEPTIR